MVLAVQSEIKESKFTLADIVKYSIRGLLRRYHLNKDWIIGLVGERGSGKSLGGGNIALRDYMFNGDPCWSNMQLGLGVEIDDEDAAILGLKGGTVIYKADHIERQSFLQLDDRYEGGCLFFDEFNLEYAEARRSMANVNLSTDKAVQQLRKMQCGLIYTVLNEMYVDNRVRENTDIFIRCCDVAFKPPNLQAKMQQGVVFEWMIYAMSPKLTGIGNTYADTGKAIGPVKMPMKDLWGIIDTYERQGSGNLKYGSVEKSPDYLLPVQMKEDPKVVEEKSKYAWIDEKIKLFYEKHASDGREIEINTNELREEFGVEPEKWGTVVRMLRRRIPDIQSRGQGFDKRKYIIPNRILV